MMSWEKGQDHNGYLDGLTRKSAPRHDPDLCGCENHADFCPFNPSSEYYRGFTSVVETPEEVTIDAARMGIKLLVNLIEETKEGKKPLVTLREIGEALMTENPK